MGRRGKGAFQGGGYHPRPVKKGTRRATLHGAGVERPCAITRDADYLGVTSDVPRPDPSNTVSNIILWSPRLHGGEASPYQARADQQAEGTVWSWGNVPVAFVNASQPFSEDVWCRLATTGYMPFVDPAFGNFGQTTLIPCRVNLTPGPWKYNMRAAVLLTVVVALERMPSGSPSLSGCMSLDASLPHFTEAISPRTGNVMTEFEQDQFMADTLAKAALEFPRHMEKLGFAPAMYAASLEVTRSDRISLADGTVVVRAGQFHAHWSIMLGPHCSGGDPTTG